MGVLWIWYCVAADYGISAVSGTYTFGRSSEGSTLTLHRNQLFEQELRTAGHIERAHGTWSRSGEGGVDFSKEFLTLGQERGSDGHIHGQVRKGFAGIFVSTIQFGPEGEGPVFHKKWRQ